MLNSTLMYLLMSLVLALQALGGGDPDSLAHQSATELMAVLHEMERNEATPAVWKPAVTTVFWVGEEASSDNDYIANDQSAWDRQWERHFGGVDDPEDRCGYRPCDFVPEENPFYVALPYNDLDERGHTKSSARDIPWFDAADAVAGSVLKNRWIAITHADITCYGQWQDVGPNHEEDFAYVFGSATTPKNTFGQRAGLDISPALRDCLGVGDVSQTTWTFVSDEAVPDGPWLEIVTK